MIQRYLGNKSSIIDPILSYIGQYCNPGDLICDIFSGTLAVSMALKKNNYRVISNDINKFSYSFGRAFLVNNTIPQIDFNSLKINENKHSNGIKDELKSLEGLDGFKFLSEKKQFNLYYRLAILLNYLNNIDNNDIAKESSYTYFFDTYAAAGNASKYKSIRGTVGNRQFFSSENGKIIDLILNKIREWRLEKVLSEELYNMLISIVAESVEKISNTQGTFHDFSRNEMDSRALKRLNLRYPPLDDVISTKHKHLLGNEEDSLEFIKRIPKHKLIYIDPPYNFRQYTSYYFMLNLICDYCEMENPNEYFSKIQFVRGQNLEKDFKSTFCQKEHFIPSLEQLITDAKAEYVMMSYFNGRNHSNNKIPAKDENGIEKLEYFFNSNLFIEGSFQLIQIKRLNYQSFNGHKAQELNEYLFIAKKA